jgi:prepilin-type processing-associated H-X9-DG protein
MKRRSPLITLLVGAALAIGLWIASMAAASPAPARSGYGAAGLPAAASSSPAQAAGPSPTASPAGAGPSPTASVVLLGRGNFAGMDADGGAAVAVAIHNNSVIVYFCDGHAVDAWVSGAPKDGKLELTGMRGARAEISLGSGVATGWIMVNGTKHMFSVSTVHAPSGLFRSVSVVHGKMIKAGWIVLADGKKIGSLEVNPDSTAPITGTAPPLNVTTLTAVDDGVTITAMPVDGETGSGF